MTRYEQLLKDLPADPRTWLITGVAGFIGSNLLETLLKLEQKVIGLDNFATGYQSNLDEVQSLVTPEQWARFRFLEGDIRSLECCEKACEGVDHVLHQAALGSVPRSIDDPIATNATNIDGFLNILVAARNAKVKSFTYAASSSTYGDHASLPKVEKVIGNPLSPYAVTKYVNELYAQAFSKVYGFHTVGLRYFNVFGRRQDPNGAYAAVIPRWINTMIANKPIVVNGDGETSRDFCYIENTIQMNILSAIDSGPASSEVFNVAVGHRTTLNELYGIIDAGLKRRNIITHSEAVRGQFREGDVRHSQASIEKARDYFGYSPTHTVTEGLELTLDWYCEKNYVA